jgi:hypothetical protein
MPSNSTTMSGWSAVTESSAQARSSTALKPPRPKLAVSKRTPFEPYERFNCVSSSH